MKSFFSSRRYLLVSAAILGLSPLQLKAQNESQTVYNFLRLPVSAHAAALGGDNVSLVDDDEMLMLHNPALLSSVSDRSLSLGYMSYMEGVKSGSAAFNRVVNDKASWAVSAQYLDYGKMRQTDENGLDEGEFSARDITLSGHFSYLLADRLAGGISARLINSYIGDYNAMAFGVDLGLNYYDSDRGLSLSLVARNLGGQLDAFDEEFERMPIDVQLGGTKSFESFPLRVSATVVDLNHLDYKFTDHLVVGAELLLSESFWLGGGYNFRRAREMKISGSDSSESSHGAGLSLGAGINLERFKVNFSWGKYHVSSSSLLFNVAFSL